MALCETARLDLIALRQQGYQPTDEDIIQLNELAKKIEQGGKTVGLVNMPRTAIVGDNIVLHEPTIAALVWWDNYGKEAFLDDDQRLLTYFWLLAHATDIEALEAVETPKEIRRAVKAWASKLTATDAELWQGLMWVKFGDQNAADLLNGEEENGEENVNCENSTDWIWSLLIMASGQTGISPNDLKTQTVSSIDGLLKQANLKAGFELKTGIGKPYIAYKELLRKIEERGKTECQTAV